MSSPQESEYFLQNLVIYCTLLKKTGGGNISGSQHFKYSALQRIFFYPALVVAHKTGEFLFPKLDEF